MYHLWRNEMYRLGDNAQKSYVVHRRLTNQYHVKKNKTQWSIVTYAYNSGRHYVRMVGYVNTTLLLLGDSQQTQSHFFSTLVLFDYKVAQALQKLFKQIIRLNTLNNYIHKLFVQIFYLIENIICNYSS